jgi:YVTN family beta-propeller protein
MKVSYLLFLFLLLGFASCKYDTAEDPAPVAVTGYPDQVEKIIISKCATEGCHTTQSKAAAAGLDLETWSAMFEGTNNGAIVIPHRPDFSTLLYFTNVDSMLGIFTQPTMPINQPPLTTQEYIALRDWVTAGAPGNNGQVMFADNPARHKFYVANQGCDVVTVFDGDSRTAMRMVDIGVVPGANPPESPHNIKITPDGKYWLVCFLNASVVQVFDTNTDQLVKTITIGNGISGQWNTIIVSSDSRKVYAADYSGRRISVADIDLGTSVTWPTFPYNLHGQALSPDNDTLYVTCQDESKLLKIPVNDIINYEEVDLIQGNSPGPFQLQPHEVVFSPDFSKYFVTCQNPNVNQVRVFNRSNDALLAVIPVGLVPLEFAVSTSTGKIFVTNQEDNTFPGMTGSVSVIDIASLTEITKIKVGWQPHGIVVDEKKKMVYVANRNYAGGPAPHHPAGCAGKNGYMSLINLLTLQVDPSFRAEVSVDPYAVTVRP